MRMGVEAILRRAGYAIAGSTDDPYLRAFGDTIVELGARAEEATRV